MEQKCYSKQELALQYFPDALPKWQVPISEDGSTAASLSTMLW